MSKEPAAPPKTHNIVVGFDFSPLSERALHEAIDLASRRCPSDLHVVVVTMQAGTLLLLPDNVNPITQEIARDTVRHHITHVIDAYHAERGPSGIGQVAVYILPGLSSGQIGHLISRVAKDVDAELVVVGSHGRRGIERMLLGSVAERVVREATTSVYVVRPMDFVGADKVPAIEPPLAPGQPHLKEFRHAHTYHYVDKSAEYTKQTMPVT
jgi:nucleotide-binding universal stress UspA family protein